MEKLFIVDGHNVLFRSYYAIRGMTNPLGESTNAVFGFIRTIYKLIHDFSPSHLVAVFDGPDGKKNREKIYSEYKANRKGMPEDLFFQLSRAQEFCRIAGIPHLEIPEVEADDTMGSIAVWAAQKGAKVYFCSSDKDLCQLIGDNIFMLQLHKNNLMVDSKKVKELFGVRPDQIIDYLAMVGDASDNIPGLEGFGPKTVSGLLDQFGTLDAILAHPEKVPGAKKQEVLIKGRALAQMSRSLATIDLTVDFPHQETFFALKAPDLPQVKNFYQEMHFLSLLKELESAPENQEEPYEPPKEQVTTYTLVDDPDTLEALEALLFKQKTICLDTETTDIRPIHAHMVGIGLGFAPNEAWYLPLNGKLGREKVTAFLKRLLSDSNHAFFGHNIKYDLHVLANEGLPIPHVCFDTMIASYVLSPEQQRHNLDILTLENFHFVKTSIESLIGKGKKQLSMDQVPLNKISAYCCEDVDYTCRLKELFEIELTKRKTLSVLMDIEIPLIPVLFKMERTGIHLDCRQMEKLSLYFSEKIQEIEKEIFHLAHGKFNLNSPKQLSEVLFSKLAIAPPKKTQTGFSTAAGVLESIQDKHPIIKKIIDYRGFEKLRSTYVDALPGQVFKKTGRIHCTFNQSVAATGRLSCQDPNLQNIPARSKEGRKIRKAFKPQHHGWSFLSLDYSQIELRLLAHLCDDPALIKAFRAGEDIHATTASLVFDVPLDAVTSEMRHKAKAVNFGILYGQQAFGLSQELAIDYREASFFIQTYFKRFTRVKEYIEFCKESVRKTGRSVTMLGRERPIPEINSKNPQIRSAAERLAINTPLQGTAADLIKLAMIDVATLLEKHNDWGSMILQIHDELIFESPDHHIQALSEEVKAIMEGIISLKVPLTVDISIGKNWEEC
jgi:DNA polymerase-1